MPPERGWRVLVVTEHPEDMRLSVVTDDDRQLTQTTAQVPALGDTDAVLAGLGWRRAGDWENGDGNQHAPVRRASRGRIPRGTTVKTKLTDDLLAEVEALVGVLGDDRSEVIAALVRAGLEVAAGGHAPDGSPHYPTSGG